VLVPASTSGLAIRGAIGSKYGRSERGRGVIAETAQIESNSNNERESSKLGRSSRNSKNSS